MVGLIQYLKGVIGISRPPWALYLSYCYFLIPFTIINQKNVYPIFLAFFTMFFFFLGHFSINAIFDRDVDSVNRRKNALNSWIDSLDFQKKWIWVMIGFFWILSLLGAFLQIILFKTAFSLIFIIIAIILAIAYSTPPLQIKGRAPLDLLVNQLSFGVIGPLFVLEILVGGLQTIPIEWILILLLFSISTLSIVVLPTVASDYSVDREYGYKTFSVKYGLKKTIQTITIFFGIQLIPILLFSLTAIREGNLVFLIMMMALVYGEGNYILYFWYRPTEYHAELIATLFSSSLFTAGVILLVYIYIIPILPLFLLGFFVAIGQKSLKFLF